MTIFFVVSYSVQALSGFVMDRFGPQPVLFGGSVLISVAAFGYAISISYGMLAGFAAVGGLCNGVFHPVDYTLLNRKVSASRMGHAYSVHGITRRQGRAGLSRALAPALVVSQIPAAWMGAGAVWRHGLCVGHYRAFARLAGLAIDG